LGLLAALATVVAVVLVAGHDQPSAGPPVGRTLSTAQVAGEPTRSSSPQSHHAGRTVPRPGRPEAKAPRPTRVRIPAIGVSAPIVRLGLAGDGTMQTPANYADAGWFAPGPEPGERGAAVIAGHVDSKSGPAVFYKLNQLRRGDTIGIARADGSVIRFRVQGLERWPKARFPTKRVFARTPRATLRLVTCSGAFDRATGHYVDNTIVYAVPA
jgi:LPXTG-site transpeptidase (sortase) family protein